MLSLSSVTYYYSTLNLVTGQSVQFAMIYVHQCHESVTWVHRDPCQRLCQLVPSPHYSSLTHSPAQTNNTPSMVTFQCKCKQNIVNTTPIFVLLLVLMHYPLWSVSKMTYTMWSGTLNSSIPYHTIPLWSDPTVLTGCSVGVIHINRQSKVINPAPGYTHIHC